ncbi:hypothetical protein [Planococcus sp. YIM B11945]|uniref:hypothetical protein n=1 Tax=Planococcus sp. YIM B11945 TaxID=3435410 RepID=UPI003D7CD5B7
MQRNQPLFFDNASYYFTRIKDTHEEDGQRRITFFGRLTIENDWDSKSIWVEIEQVKWEQATEKMKALPDSVQIYSVSAAVFQELERLSGICHQELYFITPIYKTNRSRKLA